MRKTLSWILSYHRLLADQSFYPILLSTLLALALFTARVFQSRSMA
jgi:hypothetical protein